MNCKYLKIGLIKFIFTNTILLFLFQYTDTVNFPQIHRYTHTSLQEIFRKLQPKVRFSFDFMRKTLKRKSGGKLQFFLMEFFELNRLKVERAT